MPGWIRAKPRRCWWADFSSHLPPNEGSRMCNILRYAVFTSWRGERFDRRYVFFFVLSDMIYIYFAGSSIIDESRPVKFYPYITSNGRINELPDGFCRRKGSVRNGLLLRGFFSLEPRPVSHPVEQDAADRQEGDEAEGGLAAVGAEQPSAEGGTDEEADISEAVGSEVGSPEGFGSQPVDEQAAGGKGQDFPDRQDEHAEHHDDPVFTDGKTAQTETEQEAAQSQVSDQGALFRPAGDKDLQ